MEAMKFMWIFMCGLSTLGILSQIWLVHIIQTARRGNSLTRQIDLKYSTCKKLEVQINNIEAFVGKMMENYRHCGLPLRAIASFADACAYGCVLLGLIGMYICKEDTAQLVMVAGLGFACFCMLRVVTIMVDGREGLFCLKTEIVDSLENYSRGIAMEGFEAEPVANKRFSREAQKELTKMNKSFDSIMQQNREKIIREVLQEYL